MKDKLPYLYLYLHKIIGMLRLASICYRIVLFFLVFGAFGHLRAERLKLDEYPAMVPYPKIVQFEQYSLNINELTAIITSAKNGSTEFFAAEELAAELRKEWGIVLPILKAGKGKVIRLDKKKDKQLGEEGYELRVGENGVQIESPAAQGLFYGVQTLLQMIQKNSGKGQLREARIRDWPDTKVRAAHYDTKHHQDSKQYVKQFIRELAGYKMNMLIWEWEDKFLYPSHPEIGAPGAFTMAEMQELTRYAKQYHVQIVPLVQGLGHVGFILKWPQFAHLREIPASNFEFCPLKDGSYELLLDLWKDAMEATPGSEFIHIGSDETYELGKCDNCKKKQEELGRSGLYHLFLGKSAELLKPSKRGVMAWEAPMGWAKGRLNVYHGEDKASQHKPVVPHKSLIMTESYNYETADLKYAKETKKLGYSVYAYDPNPGIEQLFLPYFFVKNGRGQMEEGALEASVKFLQNNLGKNVFDGVIRTNWDDSGLPMQAWTLCFATTAAYSWNVSGYSMEEFATAFMRQRYGAGEKDMITLYRLLNEAAYFYMESFERRVWAWGDIGKTHLPDLPRGDAIEYDPFWTKEYGDRLLAAESMLAKMDTALTICNNKLKTDTRNAYEIEVFQTLADLARHNALTYIDLRSLEASIKEAHQQRFINIDSAYYHLKHAEKIVQGQLERRQKVFSALCNKWEETRLPKGMSTTDKTYFFEQERTRHFANRVPGMEYLIYDEQLLDLEGYLEKLQSYNRYILERFKPALQP